VCCSKPWSPNALDEEARPTDGCGQLWFIELPTEGANLSPLEYRALTNSNVVIYDRALGATVAAILPLGGYAEPTASGDGEQVLERCLRFARDGWSVVRLVEGALSRAERGGRIRRLSERLIAAKVPTEQPVSLFVNAGCSTWGRIEAPLGTVIDTCSVEKRLTIVFGALGIGAPRLHTASSNGLAG